MYTQQSRSEAGLPDIVGRLKMEITRVLDQMYFYIQSKGIRSIIGSLSFMLNLDVIISVKHVDSIYYFDSYHKLNTKC